VLDKNICKVVAAEYDILVLDKAEETVAEKGKKRTEFLTDEDIDDLTPRPPVVTVMGHVDHGKTSLLDYIRKKRVAAGEAGGITQSIGAYNTSVEVDGELKTICFLDTPGHEAFSAMRARGAQVTDLAIIIVAADDGVRPQTREAVAHAQAAGVPILVAINKVDKAGADVERVKQELLELNLVAEEWGGSTPMVAVSAKKGTGIPDLLQAVTWMAEEQSLQANAKRAAQGTIIESHLDRKVGPVATLLVQAGTLKVGDGRVGDIISAGAAYGKVRTLRDDLGQPMQEAGPSIAVQMVGLGSCPMAGEEWGVVASESAAREISVKSLASSRNQRMVEMTGGGSMVTLSSLATVDEDLEALQKMNLIIKGDTMGVVEAIKNALSALPQHSVTLRFLLSNAGDISISDVDLAAASTGLVLGFNLKPDTAVEEHAKRLGVKLMTYNVIYDLIDDVKAAMEGKLRSIDEKVFLGKGEVKAVFGTGKKRVAGCVVLNGKLQKGAFVIVKRGKQVVAEGKLISLRRVKDNVDEVPEGVECGVGMEGFIEWQEKDTFECFQIVTKVRRLEEARAATAVDIPV
ncbi:Tr-type G domain-containing protein, partial [Haematococcus lacustris]